MKSEKLPYLSLITPVYNEGKRVEKGLRETLKYLRKQTFSWEAVVVNDGSTDETAKIIERVGRREAHIFLINTRHYGKGHALRVGVEAAEGKFIFLSDIDLSVPLKTIGKFLPTLKHADVVTGSRRLKESKVTRHQHKLRESLGHGFTLLSNLILGLDFSDYTCGFKGFRKEAAKKLFSHQKINGWAYDSELMFLAQRFNLKVKEMPVEWKNDPLTKVKLIPDTMKSLFSLLRIRLSGY